ncbi:hypothetical protein [Phenylobacterium sp.]|uniref:hypothetical protein n=1 Tax=Phenylobacterium sp. TaxID=1871053 RepID=UPI0025F21EAE|nr:hypothetical protein [Phenylobacterium sp.]
MKDFIDFQGASRARYRFRIWAEGAAHLPVAGNYVYVREEPEGFKVLTVGQTNDLSKARGEWTKATRRGATHVFTRLNVARAVRIAEHEDIAGHYKTAHVSEAVD